MSFPYPTLSCFLRPGHPFGYPPVSAFCTQSLDGNGKFPAPSCSLPGCRASSKGHLELSTNPPRTPPPPKQVGTDNQERGLDKRAQECRMQHVVATYSEG